MYLVQWVKLNLAESLTATIHYPIPAYLWHIPIMIANCNLHIGLINETHLIFMHLP